MKKCYLGVDLGSVSTDMVLTDENGEVFKKVYLRTQGKPVESVQTAVRKLLNGKCCVLGAGVTGSGRRIAAQMLGADVVKNEITAHAVAAVRENPQVRTVMEIGGQDSKIIFLDNAVVTDFNMNTVCAAGTGSFLDRQAQRLGIDISEMGQIALSAENPTAIAGRCAVFAESDMIHKQQQGACTRDILAGLCDAVVRNYLNNLVTGREIKQPVMFQGGVAANIGIVRAFEKQLGLKLIVPKNYDVMGAWGAALLAAEAVQKTGATKFRGIEQAMGSWSTQNVSCGGCANNCNVAVFSVDGETVGYVGNKCERFALKNTVPAG